MKKWVKPQKRMRRYPKDIKNVNWTEFIIVCKSDEDRKQIRSAMEYFHDMDETDTDFIVVNQLVHNYIHGDESDEHTDVIVDKTLYKSLKSRKHVK